MPVLSDWRGRVSSASPKRAMAQVRTPIFRSRWRPDGTPSMLPLPRRLWTWDATKTLPGNPSVMGDRQDGPFGVFCLSVWGRDEDALGGRLTVRLGGSASARRLVSSVDEARAEFERFLAEFDACAKD